MKLCQSFVPVDKTAHLTKAFDCGKAQMNTFLSRFAIKHAKLGLSRTMVLPIDEPAAEKKGIAAYYTLCASNLLRQEIPNTQSLPRYPIPVALLARLAVDRHFQGQRLGEKSLIYALRDAVHLCDAGLPAFGVVLDVLDDDALTFYQRFNFFHHLNDAPRRLFAPMTVLRKI